MIKYLIFSLLFIGICTSLKVQLKSSINLDLNQKNIYIPIKFSDAVGSVKITVKGLPEGLELRKDAIEGRTYNKTGYFPVLIDAVDQEGNEASTIYVLKVGINAINTQSSSASTTRFTSTGSSSNLNSGSGAFSLNSVISGSGTTSGSGISSGSGINTGSGFNLNSVISGSGGNSGVNSGSSGFNLNSVISGSGSTGTSRTSTTSPGFNPNSVISGSGGSPGLNSNTNTGIIGLPQGGTEVQRTDAFINNLLSRNNNNVPSNTNTNPNTNPNSFNLQTSPNLNSRSPTTTSNTPRDLDSILNQLAPLNNVQSNTRPTTSSSVTINSQTFSNTNFSPAPVPNLTPNIIRTTQAPKSQANRNVITQDDIRTTSIFQRQISANKAIANILDIVDQLRANIKAAESDMGELEAQLQNAITFQRNTQAKIIAAENRMSRLKQAIQKMDQTILLLNKQLGDLQNSFSNSSGQVLTQNSAIQKLSGDIDNFQNQAKSLNGQIKDANDELQQVEIQIRTTVRAIRDLEVDLEKKLNQMENIDQLIDDAVRNSRNIDQEINDLKRRLNAAVDRKVLSEREQLKLRNLKANNPTIIAKLREDIRLKQRDATDLQNKKGSILDKLKDLGTNLDSINSQLQKRRLELNQIKASITVTHGNKADIDDAIQKKKKQIEQAKNTTKFLQTELQTYEQGLNGAYREGNEANAAVIRAQENFAAIMTRWQQDDQKLQNALVNLQKARSQKELADLAMQQLLQEKSDALPYSIIPNGNGLTNPGSPLGNNPSGSALGQYPTSRSQAINSLVSSSTSSSISQSVSPQYPFSLYRSVQRISGFAPYLGATGGIVPDFYQGTGGIIYNGNFDCRNNLSQPYQGTIRQVGQNTITINSSSGQILVGAISGCTSSFASQPNYSPRPGDHVTFYGDNLGNGIYNIYSLNCK